MYVARLICSEPGCAETIVAEARTLRELEAMACECGCGFEVIGFPDWVDEDAAAVVVELHRVRRTDGLPEAA